MNNQLLENVKQMFPNSNLDDAMGKAKDLIDNSETKDPSSILKKAGVTEKGINDIFDKYGNTMKAKAVLGMFGTSPQALKAQALGMLKGGGQAPPKTQNKASKGTARFPKLK